MKNRTDLVKGMLRKAESDLMNAKMCLESGLALDTACFHSQQAAERTIKAYLVANEIEFPFIHNLEKLLELCASKNPEFNELIDLAGELTPYAVELRYDDEFWPAVPTAREAFETALKIKSFVMARMPSEYL